MGVTVAKPLCRIVSLIPEPFRVPSLANLGVRKGTQRDAAAPSARGVLGCRRAAAVVQLSSRGRHAPRCRSPASRKTWFMYQAAPAIARGLSASCAADMDRSPVSITSSVPAERKGKAAPGDTPRRARPRLGGGPFRPAPWQRVASRQGDRAGARRCECDAHRWRATTATPHGRAQANQRRRRVPHPSHRDGTWSAHHGPPEGHRARTWCSSRPKDVRPRLVRRCPGPRERQRDGAAREAEAS